ncbi:MAG TPA: hypothetical protein PLS49_00295 [Candidatus Woesebacteria bacterium]|nr:hypothetical protein [Candidatus Woesebacteria bacterium]
MKIILMLRKHLPFIVYILFYFSIIAFRLITKPMPFFDWDESIYAQVGIEMWNRMSLIPSWQYEIWLDKTPLVPLFYGLVIKLFPFIQPEISVRISTLILAVGVFILIYMLYYKVVKDSLLPTLVVAITSITPIFLQRSQLGNIDVFLLLGWLGYIFFYRKFWLSLLFLAIAVMSKSLVGFYPVAIMGAYFLFLFFTKQIKLKELQKEIIKLATHTGILLLWYIVMFVMFGRDFWIEHIIESHTKRVTASIESHFGKRTFYIDLLFEQYGTYIWFSILGIGALCWNWNKKYIKNEQLLYATFLIPWFLFLNVTKTKIFWYGYPYIPQFAFLMVYPITLLQKRFPNIIYYGALILVLVSVLNYGFVQQKIQAKEFASYEDHHRVAQLAKEQCDSLYVLNDPAAREAIHTLESMNLTITTTRWWGSHPSMVYYYGKPLENIYDEERVDTLLQTRPKNGCIVVTPQDISKVKDLELIKSFENMALYKL